MKKHHFVFFLALFLCVYLVYPSASLAQTSNVRASLKASVTQTLGEDTVITIEYSRPGVKGRKIWGELVPWGLAPGNRYSNDKPYPWRAGADENTTIEFSKNIIVEGSNLAAGKYGLHMIPSEKEWVIIFSKNNSSWGSFSYSQEEDALRITVTPEAAPHQEWLRFGFDDLAENSGTVFLHWEKLRVPFKVTVAPVV